MTFGCKDIGIKKSKIENKYQFLFFELSHQGF